MTLQLQTVSPTLIDYIRRLMGSPAFAEFHLAGGTALALQLGHRKSIDIDLFTCQPYGTIMPEGMKNELTTLFPIVENIDCLNNRQIVYTLYIGDDEQSIVKLDICYDEELIFPLIDSNGIRMASDKEIAAMKLLATVTGNRPKDFWDLHELLQSYSLETMIEWALKRNPYTLTRSEILEAFNKVWDFPEPEDIISLKEHKWPFIADALFTEARKLSAN